VRAASHTAGLASLLAAAIASAVGCATHRAPRTAPPGVGWYCFTRSPTFGHLVSSCYRRMASCEAAAIQDPASTRCEPASEAHCFHYRSQLFADPEGQFVCTPTACECERLKSGGWTDIGISGTCDHEP
jgi:hypothetical protein